MVTRFNRRFAAAQRRQQVAELYLQGQPQTAIAEQLGISQSTVSEDLDHVRRTWLQSAIQDFAALRAREVQKLDLIEKEAWAAWQRSQKPSQSAVVTEGAVGSSPKSRKSLKNQIGDPRFLGQISACILQRRALLGLDLAPAVPTLEDSQNANVTLEIRRERVYALLAAFSQRHGTPLAGTGPDGRESGALCAGGQRGALEDGAPSGTAGPDAADGD